jgi:ankyrin repeat protein
MTLTTVAAGGGDTCSRWFTCVMCFSRSLKTVEVINDDADYDGSKTTIDDDVGILESPPPNAGGLDYNVLVRRLSEEEGRQQQQQQRNEALLRAAKDGDLSLVISTLLQPSREASNSGLSSSTFSSQRAKAGAAFADVNYRGMWLNTPLICACQYTNSTIALELIRTYKADVDLVNERGASALHHACGEGMIEVVSEILLTYHESMETTINGSSDRSLSLSLNQPGVLYSSALDCNLKATPLMCASAAGHTGIVDILLDNTTVDVNAQIVSKDDNVVDNDNGKQPSINYTTALSYACKQGHAAIITLLITKGGAILHNITSCVYLIAAAKSGNSLAVEAILKAIPKQYLKNALTSCDSSTSMTPLHIACAKKEDTAVFAILTSCHKYDIPLSDVINKVDKKGWSPLMHACGAAGGGDKSVKIAQALVELGANVHITDKHGRGAIGLVKRRADSDHLLATLQEVAPVLGDEEEVGVGKEEEMRLPGSVD